MVAGNSIYEMYMLVKYTCIICISNCKYEIIYENILITTTYPKELSKKDDKVCSKTHKPIDFWTPILIYICMIKFNSVMSVLINNLPIKSLYSLVNP